MVWLRVTLSRTTLLSVVEVSVKVSKCQGFESLTLTQSLSQFAAIPTFVDPIACDIWRKFVSRPVLCVWVAWCERRRPPPRAIVVGCSPANETRATVQVAFWMRRTAHRFRFPYRHLFSQLRFAPLEHTLLSCVDTPGSRWLCYTFNNSVVLASTVFYVNCHCIVPLDKFHRNISGKSVMIN